MREIRTGSFRAYSVASARASHLITLIDDHTLLRTGLRSRLEKETDISVVGDADNADTGVVLARRLQPDVILLDLLMPRKGGYDALPELAKVAPEAKVLVISSQAAPTAVRRALSAGAAGYLPKRASAAPTPCFTRSQLRLAR